MVKFRGKPRKKQEPHVAGETSVVQSYSAPAGSTFFIRHLGDSSRRTKILALAGVVLLVVIAGYVYMSNKNDDTTGPKNVVHLQTEQQGLQSNLEKLQDDSPSESATTNEKVAYYDKLIIAYVNIEDYKGAVKAFEQRQKLSEEDLDYVAYISAATYYHEIDDDANAVLLLKRAQTMLPAADDFEHGYSRQSVLSGIRELLKEYSS